MLSQVKFPFQVSNAIWLPLKVQASYCWHKHYAAEIKPTFLPLPSGVILLIRLPLPPPAKHLPGFLLPSNKV